jgi:tRNA pseudouridine55 synthase
MVDRKADGLLLVDKPTGITSHAVADRARKVLDTRRVGHAGTLDPFATGLLILLVGRATRLVGYLDNEPKLYRATIRFGASTTTDDPEGDIVAQAAAPDQHEVEKGIERLTGHLLQRPPVFSAKRVAGVRAYAAARRGEPMNLEPVAVNVFKWIVLGRTGADLDVRIECSGGTYVRALARDLGETTGSAAHLVSLRRERSGRYPATDGISLDQLMDGKFDLLPPSFAVDHLPKQGLDDLDAKRIKHGQTIHASVAGDHAALVHGDELVAVAVREDDTWRPKVVMADA